MMRLQQGLVGVLALLMMLPSMAQTFAVPSEFWLTPRSGQAVRAEPKLQQAFAIYLQSDTVRLRLHHQKRDESTAQAEELRGWLIALGVEAERIELADDNPLNLIQIEMMGIR